MVFRKVALLFVVLSGGLFAQISGSGIQHVTSSPSGQSCSTGSASVKNFNGALFSCQTGVYSAVSGGGGGTIPNTPNLITGGASNTAVNSGITLVANPLTGLPSINLAQSGSLTSINPILTHHVYGGIATTTGSITSGTNQLTVASASGWQPLMGIAVAGAVSGGTELGGEANGDVCVGSISTLTFSLITCSTGTPVNATATVSGALVNHDDHYNLNQALASGASVSLSCGQYNVHDSVLDQDMLTINTPISFVGDNQGCVTILKRGTHGSVIRIGTPNFGFGNEGVLVSDLGIGMGSGFTAINGAAVYMASSGGAGTYVNSATVQRLLIIGQCNGIYTGVGVGVDWFRDIRVYGVPSTSCGDAGGVVGVDTPSPGGDIYFEGIQGTGLHGTVVIHNSDTSSFTSLKLNGDGIIINPTSDGSVFRVRFNDTSVEGQAGAPTCAISFINHTSKEISFTTGTMGLSFTNGICTTAQTTELMVSGFRFYGMGGYGLSLGGASTATVSNNVFPSTTSGAINIFGSSIVTANGNIARGTGTFISTNAVANQVFLGSNNTNLPNAIGAGTIISYSGKYRGTTSSLGGGALTVGACASGTATVTGATVGMLASTSPVTDPGDGFVYQAVISSTNTATVKVCALIAGTPTASVYNVNVTPVGLNNN